MKVCAKCGGAVVQPEWAAMPYCGRCGSLLTAADTVEREPLWCQDCDRFTDVGMDGEGKCSADGGPTWYAAAPCSKFKRKRR